VGVVITFLDHAWVRLRLEMLALAEGDISSYEFASPPPGASSLFHCRSCGKTLSSARAFANHARRGSPCERSSPTTEKPKSRKSKGGAGSNPPRGQSDVTYFERRWAKAETDNDRKAILFCHRCRDTLAADGTRAITKPGGLVGCCMIGYLRSRLLTKPDPSQRKGTREWREAVANDSRPTTTVSRAYGIRKARVVECRREFGITRQAGRPRKAEKGSRV
jgi:hypothetical protein